MTAPDSDAAAEALEPQIEQALEAGDHDAALRLLRELAQRRPDEPELQHRVGVVEEQIGSPEAALAAHLRALALAPRNPLAHLYAGYWLQRQGREAEALAVWSLGSDLDPALLRPPARRDPTGMRLQAAAQALRGHFSRLHREATGAADEARRVREAVWVQTTDRPFSYRDPRQQPHLFHISGLPPRPWFPPESWEWAAALESCTDGIREEFLASREVLAECGRPYLGRGMRLGREFAALQGSLNWTALDLYRDGVLQEGVAAQFPRTLDALTELPHYGIDQRPFEVLFSVLRPGQHIPPHYGLSNHKLTVHLPLLVPPDCALTVGGERRQWRPGRLLAFDDSFLHEAVNGSDQQRVVLIFSIWQPNLNSAERAAIQRSFRARRDWLVARRRAIEGLKC